jgi:hypothetical protein
MLPDGLKDRRLVMGTTNARMILDVAEDLLFVDGTIQLSQNLVAFVVSVSCEIFVIITSFGWISAGDVLERNAFLFLDVNMGAGSFEIGAPWGILGQPRHVNLVNVPLVLRI